MRLPPTTWSFLLFPALLTAAEPPVTAARAITFGGPGADFVKDVACDADGGVLVTGYVMGATTLEGVAVGGQGVTDVVLARWAPDGRLRWAFSCGGPAADMPHTVATDRQGRVFVCGYFSATIDFAGHGRAPGAEPSRFTSAGGLDGFVAAYDAEGRFRWARTFGSRHGKGGAPLAPKEEANQLVVAEDGTVFVAGRVMGPVDLGGGPLPAGADDGEIHTALIASWSADGALRWARTIGQGSDVQANACGLHGNDLVVAGGAQGRVDFGHDQILASAGQSDAWVLTVDAATGATRRLTTFGGPGNDLVQPGALAVGRDGTIDAGGWLGGAVAQAQPAQPYGGQDGFWARLAPDGRLTRLLRVGSGGSDGVHRLVRTTDGGIILGGWTGADGHWGGQDLPGGQGQRLALAAFSAEGRPRWAWAGGGADSTLVAGLALDGRGQLWLGGQFGGPTAFDPRSPASRTPEGRTDAFLVAWSLQ